MECMNIAMRGRWKNGKWEQTYEVNKSGIANSITTVQKDTLILEKVVDMEEVTNIMPNGTERNGTERNGTERIRVIGSLNPTKECQDRVRVFSVMGICPSIRATDYKDPPKIFTELR